MSRVINGTKTTTVVTKDNLGRVRHSTVTTEEYDLAVTDFDGEELCDCCDCGCEDVGEQNPQLDDEVKQLVSMLQGLGFKLINSQLK